MKDTDLRGIILQQFYQRRREGSLGINVSNISGVNLEGLDASDAIRICDQLREAGLIDWKPLPSRTGDSVGGVGKINAFGVDVIEGAAPSPIPLQIDQSTHVQHIHIFGHHGGVQVAGAHSHQHQTIAQELEKLVAAINGSFVPEEEKKEAKSRLAAFLESSATSAVLGPVATKLLELCR